MGKDKCVTCGAPVRVEGHTTQYYVTAYDDLKREAMKLRKCVDLFMNYTTPEDCPYPHKYSTETMAAFDKWMKDNGDL